VDKKATTYNHAGIFSLLYGRISENDRERKEAEDNVVEIHGGSSGRTESKCGEVGNQPYEKLTTSVGGKRKISPGVFIHTEKCLYRQRVGRRGSIIGHHCNNDDE
jgi:hypothetical protein